MEGKPKQDAGASKPPAPPPLTDDGLLALARALVLDCRAGEGVARREREFTLGSESCEGLICWPFVAGEACTCEGKRAHLFAGACSGAVTAAIGSAGGGRRGRAARCQWKHPVKPCRLGGHPEVTEVRAQLEAWWREHRAGSAAEGGAGVWARSAATSGRAAGATDSANAAGAHDDDGGGGGGGGCEAVAGTADPPPPPVAALCPHVPPAPPPPPPPPPPRGTSRSDGTASPPRHPAVRVTSSSQSSVPWALQLSRLRAHCGESQYVPRVLTAL